MRNILGNIKENKKVLTGAAAGLAVVVVLIIIIAVSCGKNDDTGKGTSKTTTKADITTVKKAEKDTADEQNTTEPDTELSETETTTTEDSTEVSTEETTEQPTEEQTTEEQTTEAPIPQPTQAPTETPTTTQEQTTVPAGYSPTAKFPYDETVKELHDTYGYPYPTVDYSTLPVQDFSQYFFDPEATGVQNNYFGENSKYITRITPVTTDDGRVCQYNFDTYNTDNPDDVDILITFPKEIPLYTLVNWNGKIGFFDNGSNMEASDKLMTTDFCYGDTDLNSLGASRSIRFGTNLTWDDCPNNWYLFVYIDEPK